jgi:hypothetical protein
VTTPNIKIYPHYYKSVKGLTHVDVYRVLALFQVTDPAIQHAIKKLLVAGGRGAKDRLRDYQEALDSIKRAAEMIAEDDARHDPALPVLDQPLRRSTDWPNIAVGQATGRNCADCVGQPCTRMDCCPYDHPANPAGSPATAPAAGSRG